MLELLAQFLQEKRSPGTVQSISRDVTPQAHPWPWTSSGRDEAAVARQLGTTSERVACAIWQMRQMQDGWIEL
jgi:hypothetical protein